MQRLALAVLIVALVSGVTVFALRWAADMARSEAREGAGRGTPMRDGLVQRLAYVVLFAMILGTSAGWLGEL